MELINILSAYAVIAVALMVFGIGYKIIKLIWFRITMKREMTPRTRTPHPVMRMSYFEAFKKINYDSFMRFWAKANAPTFGAHMLYHIAVGTAITTYTLSAVTLLMQGKIPVLSLSISETIVYVFDWFFKFHTEGYALLNSVIFTEVLIVVFQIALVLGLIAELTTITLSKLHKRGMISPVDEPTKLAGIRTTGLPIKSKGGWSRKIIGLMVLGIIIPMFLQFRGILPNEIAFYMHTTFALTFMAIFPYTMLFHEIARWRMWTGVVRLVDRRVA
jgi:hypothetical protein